MWEKWKLILDETTSTVAVIRDTALLLVCVIIVFFPAHSAKFLEARGFSTIHTPLGDADLKTIGGNAGSAEHLITDVLGALPEGPAKDQLQKAATQLDAVNTSVKTKIADAEPQPSSPAPAFALAPPPPSAAAPLPAPPPPQSQTFGWMFAGHVDANKQGWLPNTHRTVAEPYPLLPTATISDDVYLRADTGTQDKANAPVLTVLKLGQKITVSAQTFTPALSGGWFVWIKVPVVL